MTQRTETSIDIDAIDEALTTITALAIRLGSLYPDTSAWNRQQARVEEAHKAAMDMIRERLGMSNEGR